MARGGSAAAPPALRTGLLSAAPASPEEFAAPASAAGSGGNRGVSGIAAPAVLTAAFQGSAEAYPLLLPPPGVPGVGRGLVGSEHPAEG